MPAGRRTQLPTSADRASALASQRDPVETLVGTKNARHVDDEGMPRNGRAIDSASSSRSGSCRDVGALRDATGVAARTALFAPPTLVRIVPYGWPRRGLSHRPVRPCLSSPRAIEHIKSCGVTVADGGLERPKRIEDHARHGEDSVRGQNVCGDSHCL